MSVKGSWRVISSSFNKMAVKTLEEVKSLRIFSGGVVSWGGAALSRKGSSEGREREGIYKSRGNTGASKSITFSGNNLSGLIWLKVIEPNPSLVIYR